jgi:hypothetical protein
MTSSKNNSAQSLAVAMHYETLRKAALGDVLPPEARGGLMLFLRRGMWGWAQAVAGMCALQQPTGFRPSDWKPLEEHRGVIHILAAMTINANY